jgi:hypothetical protein
VVGVESHSTHFASSRDLSVTADNVSRGALVYLPLGIVVRGFPSCADLEQTLGLSLEDGGESRLAMLSRIWWIEVN